MKNVLIFTMLYFILNLHGINDSFFDNSIKKLSNNDIFGNEKNQFANIFLNTVLNSLDRNQNLETIKKHQMFIFNLAQQMDNTDAVFKLIQNKNLTLLQQISDENLDQLIRHAYEYLFPVELILPLEEESRFRMYKQILDLKRVTYI